MKGPPMIHQYIRHATGPPRGVHHAIYIIMINFFHIIRYGTGLPRGVHHTKRRSYTQNASGLGPPRGVHLTIRRNHSNLNISNKLRVQRHVTSLAHGADLLAHLMRPVLPKLLQLLQRELLWHAHPQHVQHRVHLDRRHL